MGGQRVIRCAIAPQELWPEAGQLRAAGMAQGRASGQSVAGNGDSGMPAGLGCLSVSFLVSLYYNTVLTWVLWYLLNSFQQPLPWGTCPLDLNRTGDAGPGRRARLPQSLHGCSEAARLRSGSLTPRVCSLLDLGPTDAPLFTAQLVGLAAELEHGAEGGGCFSELGL